jgi:hypothetical protein
MACATTAPGPAAGGTTSYQDRELLPGWMVRVAVEDVVAVVLGLDVGEPGVLLRAVGMLHGTVRVEVGHRVDVDPLGLVSKGESLASDSSIP